MEDNQDQWCKSLGLELPVLPSAEEIEQEIYADTRRFVNIDSVPTIQRLMKTYAVAALKTNLEKH